MSLVSKKEWKKREGKGRAGKGRRTEAEEARREARKRTKNPKSKFRLGLENSLNFPYAICLPLRGVHHIGVRESANKRNAAEL